MTDRRFRQIERLAEQGYPVAEGRLLTAACRELVAEVRMLEQEASRLEQQARLRVRESEAADVAARRELTW